MKTNILELQMTVREIYEKIDERSPFDAALDWDNSGLLAGDMESEVSGVYLAVDATDDVIEHAHDAGCNLLVTHHPLIFGSIKAVTEDDFTGRRVKHLIEYGMSLICMHTNYDMFGMAEAAAEKLSLIDPVVLDICGEDAEGIYGIGRTGALAKEITLEELAEKVKKAYSVDTVKVFGDPGENVRLISVCPGSGKSVLSCAIGQGADVLVTGDIDHHSGIDAVMQGMAVIDAGHYGIEKIFVDDMYGFLGEHFPKLLVKQEPVSEPFTMM